MMVKKNNSEVFIRNMEELSYAVEKIINDNVVKLIVSNKLKKDEKYNKICFVLKNEKGKQFYHIEKYTDKQVFHENISLDTLEEKIIEYTNGHYKQISAWTENKEFQVKISKKGKVLISGKKSNNAVLKEKISKHNKEKNYILKEGMKIPALIDLGVFTKEGKVINSKYDKYKQINKFIEIIDNEIKDRNYKELTILDFGCGKSYLTFVLYYYLVEIRGIKANIIGLDLKEDVIEKCNKIAESYGYNNLHFKMGNINGFHFDKNPDMVITLHACDTATDYALYNAVKWNTDLIFSVPCCQHELNSQMEADSLGLFTRYGIIQERIAALATDAIRANLLEAVGYKTQLLEFIDIAHSPKNILIRAVKDTVSEDKKKKCLQEVKAAMKEFGYNPCLYKLFAEDKYI